MYTLTKKSLINTVKDSATGADYWGINTVAASGGRPEMKFLSIRGFGEFAISGVTNEMIVDENIKAIPSMEGVNEKLEFTMPAGSTEAVGLKVELRIKSVNKNEAENSSYAITPTKPLVIEFEKQASASANAALYKKMYDEMQLFGKDYVNISVSGATVTITAKDEFDRFSDGILISENVPTISTNKFVTSANKLTVVSTITPGTLSFGNQYWLERTFFDPNNKNYGKLSMNKDRKPIDGSTYTLYTWDYEVKRNNSGISVLNGIATCITTFELWVNDAIKADFETFVKGAGIKVNGVTA